MRSGTRFTARERDVLRFISQGFPAELIAIHLGASVETIELYSRIGLKTGGERMTQLLDDLLRHRTHI